LSSRDGGVSYRADNRTAGLPSFVRGVTVAAPGLYLAFDDTAAYRSTDGLSWTRTTDFPHH
jgi:hypothetical protein